MARISFRRRRPTPPADVEKAPGLAPAAVQDFSELVNQLTTMSRDTAFPYRPLPRNPGDGNIFGPSSPFRPEPLDPPRDDGRSDPRYREYPVAWNLELLPTPHIPFKTLRDASNNIDLVRRCIEKRKKEIASRDWSFSVAPWAVNQASAMSPGTPTQDIEARLMKEYADDIARANAFWQMPGRNQDLQWADWVYAALEEYLVVDAVVVYPQKTYGGDLLSLDLVMGETIKPLLDERGGKPRWPYPAYQQVLYGFPRGEYTATTQILPTGDVTMSGAYLRDQLYYIRRCSRIGSPYGMSAVEQALISARLYLKRQGWMLSEYDDGTVPQAWIESVLSQGDIDMDAAQRRMWEDALNDELSGNTAARHRLKVMPPGMRAVETSSVDERYKPDYDLFLIKLLASHFDVPISELGFSEAKGLGSSGFHESQADSYERSATLPDTRWFSNQITRISHEQLGIRPEVVHKFAGLDDEDEAAMDAVWENRVRSMRATINEDRARLNLPLFSFPEANMPMLATTRGVVFVAGASKLAPGGTMIEPAEYAPPEPGEPQSEANAKPSPSAAAKGELAAFHKWAAKHPNPSRPFEFKHLTPDNAPDLADDPRVTWSD
jgi:hypothetical protein